jgi:hypothetical protein
MSAAAVPGKRRPGQAIFTIGRIDVPAISPCGRFVLGEQRVERCSIQ